MTPKPYARILCHRLGYIIDVRKNKFTAVMSDRQDPKAYDEEWEVEIKKIPKEDRKFIRLGQVFRFFIVVGRYGIQAKSKFVWGREKWSAREIRYIKIRAKQLHREWNKLPKS